MADLREIQKIEYLQSLLADQMKDLLQERSAERKRIRDLLSKNFPANVEQLLTPEQARLLRSARFRSTLNPTELKQLEQIESQINQWREECYNMAPEYQRLLAQHGRLFQINDFPRKMCFDIGDSAVKGMVNLGLKMVDVNIGEHRYPLNPEDSERAIQQMKNLQVDFNKIPPMSFPEIERTQIDLQDAQDAQLARKLDAL